MSLLGPNLSTRSFKALRVYLTHRVLTPEACCRWEPARLWKRTKREVWSRSNDPLQIAANSNERQDRINAQQQLNRGFLGESLSPPPTLPTLATLPPPPTLAMQQRFSEAFCVEAFDGTNWEWPQCVSSTNLTPDCHQDCWTLLCSGNLPSTKYPCVVAKWVNC